MAHNIPDVDAPILPGISSAGISIGDGIESLPGQTAGREIPNFGFHEFPSVKVWTRLGRIVQIGVSQGYRGFLDGRIGVGSTIAEIEDWSGCQVVEGLDDEFVVEDLGGWSFETEEWTGDHTIRMNRASRVTAIFVHGL